MHVRFLRAALTIPLLFGLLVIAGTTAATAADAAVACKAPKVSDGTTHIQGCLRDKRGGGDRPVSGVTIEVLDDQGNAIVDGVTDDTGLFDLQLPGKDIDIIGKSYIVKIDTGTLPDGTALQDPKRKSLTATIISTGGQFFTFPMKM